MATGAGPRALALAAARCGGAAEGQGPGGGAAGHGTVTTVETTVCPSQHPCPPLPFRAAGLRLGPWRGPAPRVSRGAPSSACSRHALGPTRVPSRRRVPSWAEILSWLRGALPFRCSAGTVAPGLCIYYEQPQPVSAGRQVLLGARGWGLHGCPPLASPSHLPVPAPHAANPSASAGSPLPPRGTPGDRVGSACRLRAPPPPCLPEVKPEPPTGRPALAPPHPGCTRNGGGRAARPQASVLPSSASLFVDCVSETPLLFQDQTFSVYMRRHKAFSVKNLQITF